ncbi:hypothetical protein BN1708_016919 [Verticillium longisporum]|uniref:Uncharacterized protein n=1 Tax=Verticillium longisporum TaxID=100787 RepID=A0A0G4N6U0_VERLO|nr:hypothetical protein BN1708_016919 [Verticillium longisporum]
MPATRLAPTRRPSRHTRRRKPPALATSPTRSRTFCFRIPTRSGRLKN